MTQYQAKKALNEGFAIKHLLFSDDEYIHRLPENGQLIDEVGIAIDECLFWQERQGEIWQDGWKLHLLELPPPPEVLTTSNSTPPLTKNIYAPQLLARGTGKTRSLEYLFLVGRPTLKLPRKRKKKFIKAHGRNAYQMYRHRLYYPQNQSSHFFTPP